MDCNSIQIAPSIMCADLCHLEEDIHRLEAAGVDMLHFDLMDAHFVPNMPLGFALIEQLRPRTVLPFDVHLMVEDNDFFIRRLTQIGVQRISVHFESSTHLDRTLALIRENDIKAGVALNPSTPVSVLCHVLEQIDCVLIMTVNPGFAGQKIVPSTLRKIADCRAFLRQWPLDIPIQVDGNVSFKNIPKMVAAGADILVAGTSSVFHKGGTRSENIQRARHAISRGLEMGRLNTTDFEKLPCLN